MKTDNSLPKGSRKSGYKRKMTELTPSPQMLTTSKKPKEDVQTSRAAVAAILKSITHYLLDKTFIYLLLHITFKSVIPCADMVFDLFYGD